MHQNKKCIRKEKKKKKNKLRLFRKMLLLNKQTIKMTSLQISGEA